MIQYDVTIYSKNSKPDDIIHLLFHDEIFEQSPVNFIILKF